MSNNWNEVVKRSEYLDKIIKYETRLLYGLDRDDVVEAEEFMKKMEGLQGFKICFFPTL